MNEQYQQFESLDGRLHIQRYNKRAGGIFGELTILNLWFSVRHIWNGMIMLLMLFQLRI